MENQRYAITADSEKKIIIVVYSGYVKFNEVCAAWKSILDLDEFRNKGYGLLSDFSDVELSFSIDKTDEIWSFLESIKEFINGKKQAVVTTRPLTTAMSVLIENESFMRFRYSIRTFSTREVALEWLQR